MDSNLIHMTRSLSGSNDGHNRIILYITREKMESYDQHCPSLQLVRFMEDYYGVYHLDREQQALVLNLFRTLRYFLADREHNYKTGIDLEILAYFERTFKTYMTLSPLKYRKTLNTVTCTSAPNPMFSARLSIQSPASTHSPSHDAPGTARSSAVT